MFFFHFCKVANGAIVEVHGGVKLAKTKMCWELYLAPLAIFLISTLLPLEMWQCKFCPLPNLEVGKSSYTWNPIGGFWLIFFCIWEFLRWRVKYFWLEFDYLCQTIKLRACEYTLWTTFYTHNANYKHV